MGREIVYAPNAETELALKKQAFLRIDIFQKVLDYYKGSNLPDMKYLGNTLTKEFGLEPETHELFAKIFRENCQYLGIISGAPESGALDDEDNGKPVTIGTVTLTGVTPPLVKYCTLRNEARPAGPEGSRLAVSKPGVLAPVVITSQVDVLPLER